MMFVVSSPPSLVCKSVEVWRWEVWSCGDTRKHFPVRRDASRPSPASLPALPAALSEAARSTLSQSSGGPPRPWVGIILTSLTGHFTCRNTACSYSTDSHCRLFRKSVKQQPNLPPTSPEWLYGDIRVQIETHPCDIRAGRLLISTTRGSSLSV